MNKLHKKNRTGRPKPRSSHHSKKHHAHRGERRDYWEFVVIDGIKGRLSALSCKKLSTREFVVPKTMQQMDLAGHLIACTVDRARNIKEILYDFGDWHNSDNLANMLLAMAELTPEFSDKCEQAALEMHEIPMPTRLNRHEMAYITIDGATAKDFDDAVFAKPEGDKIRVFVAIADVSFFVKQDSILDKEAQKRGNSVYLPGFVAPMVPHALSSDLCSLLPQKPRLAIEVNFLIDANGNISNPEFNQVIIQSHARLTYQEIQEFIDGKAKFSKDINISLDNLIKAHNYCENHRQNRFVLELNLPEYEVEITNKTITGIAKRLQTTAHKLIENMMVSANSVVGEFLYKKSMKPMMRRHENPPMEKTSQLREKLMVYDISVPDGNLYAQNYADILRQANENQTIFAVSEILLRCQAQAHYTIESHGHFGLQIEYYLHFTSPIRRYADLMVHRALYHAMGWNGDESMPKPAKLSEIAQHISDTERTAMLCEREAFDRAAAYLLADDIGEIFPARIKTFTQNGFFARFNHLPIDCFVDYETMPADFYTLNTTNTLLSAKRTRMQWAVNDIVRIKLVEANWVNANIAGALMINSAIS